MTAVSDRYDKLAGQMSARIAAVPADAWDNPTPCSDWTARDLLDHVLSTPSIFFNMAEVEAPEPGPDPGANPVGAFEHQRAAVNAALADPAVAQKEFDGMMGRRSFEDAIDTFICADLVVHQWDLARATGQDESLEPAEVAKVHAALLPADEMMRGPNAFGPKIEPPADADDQTKFLNFLGREV